MHSGLVDLRLLGLLQPPPAAARLAASISIAL